MPCRLWAYPISIETIPLYVPSNEGRLGPSSRPQTTDTSRPDREPRLFPRTRNLDMLSWYAILRCCPLLLGWFRRSDRLFQRVHREVIASRSRNTSGQEDTKQSTPILYLNVLKRSTSFLKPGRTQDTQDTQDQLRQCSVRPTDCTPDEPQNEAHCLSLPPPPQPHPQLAKAVLYLRISHPILEENHQSSLPSRVRQASFAKRRPIRQGSLVSGRWHNGIKHQAGQVPFKYGSCTASGTASGTMPVWWTQTCTTRSKSPSSASGSKRIRFDNDKRGSFAISSSVLPSSTLTSRSIYIDSDSDSGKYMLNNVSGYISTGWLNQRSNDHQ